MLAPAFTVVAQLSSFAAWTQPFHYVEPISGGDDVLTTSWAGVMRVNARSGALAETVLSVDAKGTCWGGRAARDGRVVAAGFGTGELFVRRDGETLGPCKTPGIAIRTSLSDDGSRVAVQCANKILVVLDASSLTPLWQLDLKKSFANGMDMDEHGRALACAGTDGLVRIFDASSGNQLGHAETTGWANDVAFRANRIAVGGRAKSVHVLDKSGAALRSLVYGAAITRVSLSHDGKRCAASSTKGAALVWDVETGEPIACLDASTGVTSATFSPIAEGPTGYRVVASLGPEHAKPPAIGTWHVP